MAQHLAEDINKAEAYLQQIADECEQQLQQAQADKKRLKKLEQEAEKEELQKRTLQRNPKNRGDFSGCGKILMFAFHRTRGLA